MGVFTTGANGRAVTITSICVRGPSQFVGPAPTWLTQYDVVPAVVVDGVGAVALPTPPVAVVYYNNVLPAVAVAVNATAVAFKQ